MLNSGMGVGIFSSPKTKPSKRADQDQQQMLSVVRFTARTLATASPRPFGASIVESKTGKRLLQAVNTVTQHHDPSSHAEVHAIRLATRRLKTISLKGFTLYTTCEPCPMCMSAALWAGLDRIVYGVTIEDASQHCNQIHIPAREVAERSDMRCVVDGPVAREACYALFTDPRMLKAFKLWSSRKTRK